MIENITEEQLQKIIEEYALPSSNIGVHEMTGDFDNDYEKTKIIFDGILKNGFKARGGYNGSVGLTSHISISGLSNSSDVANNVFKWDFAGYQGEKIRIIFAIPSIIDINGKKYFIGEFPKTHGRDNDSETIPYEKFVETIPKEFIIGHLKITYGALNKENGFIPRKYDFIINDEYIGLKNYEDQQVFFQKYEDVLKQLGVLTFDEVGYSLAERMNTDRTKRGQANYYYQKYFEKYEELQNRKTR